MKRLKVFAFSFLAIVFSFSAQGERHYPEYFFTEEETFHEDRRDIREKSIVIMNIIDQSKNKAKNKILSTLLEVELNILTEDINSRITKVEKSISDLKKESIWYTNPQLIKQWNSYISLEEEKLQTIEEALQLAEQWKRDYCH